MVFGGAALALPASATAGSTTTTTGKARPPETGTIKIDGVPMVDGEPERRDHRGCDFTITFFNYGRVDNATVRFDGDGIRGVRGQLNPAIGEDEALGQGDRDGRATYRVILADPAYETFQLDITVRADGSAGSDSKSQRFLVNGCKYTTPTTPPTSPPTEPPSTPPTTQPTEEPSTPSTESPSTPAEPQPTASQSAPGVPAPSAPAIPTVVDAGLAKSSIEDDSPAPIGIGLLVGGAGLLAASGALALRRRGKHTS